MTKTMTIYRITASWEHCGHLLDCTDAATLGDAYGEMYATIEAAEEMAEQLTDSVDEYDLDPTTSYSVEPVAVEIADVAVEADYDGDGEGHAAVTATVHVIGPLPRRIETAWYVKPRHCALSVDGWIPAEGGLDADVIRVVGTICAAAIGREIVAGVR